MSPRRHHRAPGPEPLDQARARSGGARVESWRDGQWLVRPVTAAAKTYRCPGCDHEIRPNAQHLVSWPADERGDLADRRHWHNGCWRARDRRPPR
ncbi:hypothetical protein [Pilimelia columellifera]|uniref:ATP/GTP-binding protein n=1 Tax=Pilimelia columellifera subsp. columellifera TaxID=706583 RepID=A0ABN3NIL3_9ACTN